MKRQLTWLISLVLLLVLVLGQGLAVAGMECSCLSAEHVQHQPVVKTVKQMPCCPDTQRCDEEQPCDCQIKAATPSQDIPASLHAEKLMMGAIPLNMAVILRFAWLDDPTGTYRLFYPDKRKSYLKHQKLLI